MQIKLGKIKTALVCANDEITQDLHSKADKVGFKSTIKDCSYAVMLSSENHQALRREEWCQPGAFTRV
jgi:hypothetical protein